MGESDSSVSTVKTNIVVRLEDNDLDGICEMASRQRAVAGILTRLAYDKTTLVGWRAILGMGRIARKLVTSDYEFLRIIIRKLLWTLSDESGGIGWSSPEMLGEIVSADPVKMSDVIPLIAEVYDIEEATFRPGVLYALKRIAETRPASILPYRRLALKGMAEPDPLTRLYAIDLLSVLVDVKPLSPDMMEVLKNKINDHGIGWIYRDSGFIYTEVSELAKVVIDKCQ